uniref:Uncharacterized protein n=1 Tax=viral metagenome TaxID=1070528 RepID=A0A6M3MC44_9ZZZZ
MTTPNKIDKYLVHTVDRVRPTVVKGLRSTSTEEDLPARIVNRTRILRGVGGDQIVTKMVVYLKPDADVVEGDELIVDSKQRPVVGLIPARDGRGIVHHLEAEMG